MTKKEKYWLLGIIAAGLLIIPRMAKAMHAGAAAAAYGMLEWMIPEFEGFRATPYWDISRWTWGYGTAAPGSTGTISKAQALIDARAVWDSDYAYLSKLITRPLSGNQWAALLDFSYNLGRGNADNLVTNINSGDDDALQAEWMQYVHAGGVVSQDLADRRTTEWEIWTGQL